MQSGAKILPRFRIRFDSLRRTKYGPVLNAWSHWRNFGGVNLSDREGESKEDMQAILSLLKHNAVSEVAYPSLPKK